jgi:hypothetical protein
MIVASPASNAVAPTVPNRLYIYPANRGKAKANTDRRNALPAIADAETDLYATTRYVKVELNEKHTPVPNGMDAIIGTTQ